MNKTGTDAVDRAEAISAKCDELMTKPPNDPDGLKKARMQVIEQIARLEAIQSLFVRKYGQEFIDEINELLRRDMANFLSKYFVGRGRPDDDR